MSELPVEDYIAILNGEKRGSNFSSNYYVIAHEEKNKSTQKDILLEEGIGMPASYIRNTFLRNKYTRLNNYDDDDDDTTTPETSRVHPFLTPDTNPLRPTVSTFLSNREKLRGRRKK